MQNRVKKVLMLTTILCVMGTTVCSCQNTKETQYDRQEQDNEEANYEAEKAPIEEKESKNPSGTISEDDAGDHGSNRESDKEDGDENNHENQSETNGGTITSATPDLEGTIKKIRGRRLTVVESMTEKGDHGGDVIVSPGSGDDSKYNKIGVECDENTVFIIKNIYEGGARSKIKNGSASDLNLGQSIEVWGSSKKGVLKATQICIISVK